MKETIQLPIAGEVAALHPDKKEFRLPTVEQPNVRMPFGWWLRVNKATVNLNWNYLVLVCIVSTREHPFIVRVNWRDSGPRSPRCSLRCAYCALTENWCKI